MALFVEMNLDLDLGIEYLFNKRLQHHQLSQWKLRQPCFDPPPNSERQAAIALTRATCAACQLMLPLGVWTPRASRARGFIPAG